MYGIKPLGLCLLSAALLLAGTAQAANRALLVGVGDYIHTVNFPKLSGIDIDIDIMRQWVPLLGFTQVEVLQNEQATYANVRAALQKLVSGMDSGDRALFYRSGVGAGSDAPASPVIHPDSRRWSGSDGIPTRERGNEYSTSSAVLSETPRMSVNLS